MLLSLNIKNAALISSLRLEFDSGLNILSGETGAGKSIIIDSLSFALGSKADKTLIRHNENIMSAEAVFDISKNTAARSFLLEMGSDDDTLILYRSLSAEGKSDIRINGKSATLSMLKEISSKLVDIYGQSEHISLLKPSTHLDMIDGYGKAEILPVKEELKNLYVVYKKTLNELKSFGGSQRERERLIDLYRYQIEEIENAKLFEGEEEELINKRNKLMNMEKLSEEAGEAQKLLGGGEYGAASGISKAASLISRCMKYDDALSGISERLDCARLEIDDIYAVLSDYIYSLEYDGREADNTEKRLDAIKGLKRKYGNDIEEINRYLAETKAELERLEKSSETIEELNRQKTAYEKKLYEICLKLSGARKACAANFEKEVLNNLSDLSMKGSCFKTEFSEFPPEGETERKITENGMDSAEFLISPNKGEPLKPLVKIISGGEMSRFMLAIKSIISDTDNIGTLIFDEIDTGISGVTAAAVAKKFASVSLRHQIIAITHLPQIAAMGDSNYLITKNQIGGGTQTFIGKLSDEGAIDEVARLIGAADVSVHAAMHAKELIAWSDNYKKEIKKIGN